MWGEGDAVNRRAILIGIALFAVLLLASIARQFAAPAGFDVAAQMGATSSGPRAPVLVELFTSEGCSSCPPADALLARLDQAQPVAGAEIIALKEHVDYWNHLGWRDRFSSAKFSERQDHYAGAFGNSGVYTPQMIVDGQAEFVGSSEQRAFGAIARAAHIPKAQVRLAWKQDPGKPGISLDVRADALPGVTPGDAIEVFLAITESKLHSDVRAGENAGRSLDHAAVVRQLELIGQAFVRADPAFMRQLELKLAPEWKRENLRAVVFLQERKSRRVLGASAIAVPAP